MFAEMAERAYDEDPSVEFEDFTEILAGMFENSVEEISGITLLPEGFVKDTALHTWSQVNWDEIAKHYAEDVFVLFKR